VTVCATQCRSAVMAVTGARGVSWFGGRHGWVCLFGLGALITTATITAAAPRVAADQPAAVA